MAIYKSAQMHVTKVSLLHVDMACMDAYINARMQKLSQSECTFLMVNLPARSFM